MPQDSEKENPPEIFSQLRDPTSHFEGLKQSLLENLSLIHKGENLLFPAVKSGDQARVSWLLDQGLNINQQDDLGYTPLVMAFFQDENLVRLLIDRGADLELGSKYRETPLRLTIRMSRYELLKHLIQRGINTEQENFTELHIAAAFGDIDRIKTIVYSSRASLEQRDSWERTPWLTALCANQLGAAKTLETLGANTTALAHRSAPALHLCAKSNATSTLSHLLDLGADINLANDFKETALHLAAEYDSYDSAKILLAEGIDLTRLNEVKEQAINNASSLKMLQLLHSHGADINHVDGCGYWPLKTMAECNNLEAIQWLIANGADVNQTSTGETALHTAVRNSSMECIEALVIAGADVNAEDCDIDTALFCCTSVGAAEYLISRGADPHHTNIVGQTAAQSSYVNENVRAYLKSLS